MKTALLISTYNWPAALETIFSAVKNQSVLPDEILIADDGSRDDTKLLINRFGSESGIFMRHVWHEDNGFRKAKILNKAIAATDADYIIQLDGDCIPEKRFVEDHLKNAAENTYLYGTRVGIRSVYVNKTLENKTITFGFFSKQIKSRSRMLHIPLLSKLYRQHKAYSTKFRGCNVSFWRSDFIAINGYNEDFEGWGKEDSDLAIRLNNNGLYARRLRYAGIVFHLDHPIKSKENLERNKQIQANAIASKIIRCENGVDKYL